ncbi:MAG: phytanoyl-CoA dioxygenase family protein [Acidimicrobiales bacterium]
MVTDADIERFHRDGFVVVPGFLSPHDLGPARANLGSELPTAGAFFDHPDASNERFRDEFAGITSFPFESVELSLLSVHERLIDLAERLLGRAALRVYSVEAWAKFTGAADYDQPLHRDYLNHSLLVPTVGAGPSQVEMFLYLSDVSQDVGPPSLVPTPVTEGLGALPNWYPRSDGVVDSDHPGWVSPSGRSDLYEREVAACGPAGTVVAYRIETFHRGTALRAHRGVRHTLHVNFRLADHDWIGRRAWTDSANSAAWEAFVVRATARQLGLFGFPLPGHPYWSDETVDGVAQRYPGLDVSPWRRRADPT